MGWVIMIVVILVFVCVVAYVAYRIGERNGIAFCEEYIEKLLKAVNAGNRVLEKEIERLKAMLKTVEFQLEKEDFEIPKRSDEE